MYIGIDLGTTAVKTVAYDKSGEVLAETESEYSLITENGGVFQDAGEWWSEVRAGVSSVVAESGVREVDGISVSTQGIAFVATDESAVPLAPAVSWLDARAADECAALVGRFGEAGLHRVTGKIPLPTYTLPMLMRFRRDHPDVFDAAARFCLPLDFINLRLTGRHVADHTVAGGTMAYDISRREYDGDLLDFAGVPEEKLPEIGCMGDFVGTVLPDVAAELGITGEMKVFLGGQDQKLAALGAGIDDGVMTVSIGTATAVTRLLDKLPDDPRQSLFAFDNERFSSEGVVATSGSALKWFKYSFFGGVPYRELDVLAEQTGTSAGVTVVPDFTSGASISGITLATSAGNVLYALYEGVCRQIAEKAAVMGGAKQLKVFGGGSRSDVWCQILADISRLPVAVCETPQTACLGAAILASGGKISPCGIKKVFQPRG